MVETDIFRQTFKTYVENAKFGRNVLESLLVSSMDGNKIIFPTPKRFILSEVVNGTIEYVGGESGKINYRRDWMSFEHFEEKLNKYFKEELKNCTKRNINPKILLNIRRLCRSFYVSPTGPDRPYIHARIYDVVSDIFRVHDSSISLPYEIIKRVQEKTLPSFTEEQRKDIEGIGKSMRPEIEKDLAHIRKRYSW